MASSQQSEMECDSDGFSSDYEYYSDQDNAQNRYHTEHSDSSLIDGDEITSSSSSSDSDSESDGECQSDLPTGMSAKEYLRFVLETLDAENLPEFNWAGSEKVFCSPNFQPATQPGPTRTISQSHGFPSECRYADSQTEMLSCGNGRRKVGRKGMVNGRVRRYES